METLALLALICNPALLTEISDINSRMVIRILVIAGRGYKWVNRDLCSLSSSSQFNLGPAHVLILLCPLTKEY